MVQLAKLSGFLTLTYVCPSRSCQLPTNAQMLTYCQFNIVQCTKAARPRGRPYSWPRQLAVPLGPVLPLHPHKLTPFKGDAAPFKPRCIQAPSLGVPGWEACPFRACQLASFVGSLRHPVGPRPLPAHHRAVGGFRGFRGFGGFGALGKH